LSGRTHYQQEEGEVSQPASDRNLLLGVLAVQLDLVPGEALLRALHAWVNDKGRSLAQILVGQGVLTDDEGQLLEALVQKHVERHGNDLSPCLAAGPAVGSVRAALESLADPDLSSSLTRLTTAPDGHIACTPPPTASKESSRPRYRVIRPHARGGLGQVFVAFDEEVQREVALKEIQDRHADDPGSRFRFLREAEITGRLEHPGIVPVHSLGRRTDGRPFYVMRLVRGETFADAIRRFHQRPDARREATAWALERNRLLRCLIDVCQAVAYAHGQCVIHRDIKPENIMRGPFGEVYLIDWGLAKVMGSPSAPASGDHDTPGFAAETGPFETRPGSTLGTPAYMSPEQAAGRVEEGGPASDVYSLGATLYCLLTAHPPFEGGTVEDVLGRVQAGNFPTPRQVLPRVAEPLEAVCLKAMALRPEDRYPTALALAEDLELWLAGRPVSAYQPVSSQRLPGQMTVVVCHRETVVYKGNSSSRCRSDGPGTARSVWMSRARRGGRGGCRLPGWTRTA
jgi:eukaryotic-like serine/threonine-protein kinase